MAAGNRPERLLDQPPVEAAHVEFTRKQTLPNARWCDAGPEFHYFVTDRGLQVCSEKKLGSSRIHDQYTIYFESAGTQKSIRAQKYRNRAFEHEGLSVADEIAARDLLSNLAVQDLKEAERGFGTGI